MSASAPPLIGVALTGNPLTGKLLTGVALTGMELTGMLLTGTALTGMLLTGMLLTGMELTGMELTGMELTGMLLTGTALTGMLLTGMLLTGKSLPGAVSYPVSWVSSGAGRGRWDGVRAGGTEAVPEDFAGPKTGGRAACSWRSKDLGTIGMTLVASAQAGLASDRPGPVRLGGGWAGGCPALAVCGIGGGGAAGA